MDNLALAVDQSLQGVTGDQSSAWTRTANAPNAMLGAAQQWADSVGKTSDAWKGINAPATPGGPPPGAGEKTVRVIRAAQQTLGGIMGGLGLVKSALDVGFANLTAPLAAIFPSLPAATVLSPYIGTPHAHVAHPPSGPPPAPPHLFPALEWCFSELAFGCSLTTCPQRASTISVLLQHAVEFRPPGSKLRPGPLTYSLAEFVPRV